ncbi:hypothetical protein [Gluconacetobacter diazotrophicus]|uniref:Conserved hypothetical n=1 Tax=Gluconacetobacter diazotrophicus (strain ATCC 49037 / DSM 5601 / CCUG 37298 / CIP 103539 / LMG 7603 / PAl5) TaxID=272568 RepID=A9HT94_GLUDA|nr:hypothetical protein [Gluconacetobacter diazotrophicus]CAP57879.1 conserved hypothetical [Gluconacetobacter diazotrophicus PA1 5]
MRFKKWDRHPFNDTSRKRAALRRKQQRERDSAPLLAAFIAEQQPDEDAVMESRAETWARQQQASRDRRARIWRDVRRQVEALPDPVRRAVLDHWNTHRWFPGDPLYLSDVLRALVEGRLYEQDGKIVSPPYRPWNRKDQIEEDVPSSPYQLSAFPLSKSGG